MAETWLVSSAVVWSFVPLIVALSGAGEALWWSAIFYLSEGAVLTAMCLRRPNSFAEMMPKLMRRCRRDRRLRRAMAVVLVGTIHLPLFVAFSDALGPAAATAVYELWPVALGVMCFVSGRGTLTTVPLFAAACCAVTVGVLLISASRGDLTVDAEWAQPAQMLLMVASLSMPMLGGAVVLATLVVGERLFGSGDLLPVAAEASRARRAWQGAKPSLLPFIALNCPAAVVFAVFNLVTGVPLPARGVTVGAVIAGLLGAAYVVLIRMGNVAGASGSNLLMAVSPAMALAWLAVFADLELGKPWRFAAGAALIIVGSVTVQWRPNRVAIRERDRASLLPLE